MNLPSQQDDSLQLMEGREQQPPNNWTHMTEETNPLQGNQLLEIKQEPSEQFILSDNVFVNEDIEEPTSPVWLSKPSVSNINLPNNQQTIYYNKPMPFINHVTHSPVDHIPRALTVDSEVTKLNPPSVPSAGTTTSIDKSEEKKFIQAAVKLEDKSTQYITPAIDMATMTDEIKCPSTAVNTDMKTDDMIYVLDKKCKGVLDLLFTYSDGATSSEEIEESEDSWKASNTDSDETSVSDNDHEQIIFKNRCLEMTRKLHEENFEKYLGLPPDCQWVPSALAQEMKKSRKILSNQDIVELIIRKSHLHESFSILGDYYGISFNSVVDIYFNYHNFVISKLSSIGIRIDCYKNGCCEHE